MQIFLEKIVPEEIDGEALVRLEDSDLDEDFSNIFSFMYRLLFTCYKVWQTRKCSLLIKNKLTSCVLECVLKFLHWKF